MAGEYLATKKILVAGSSGLIGTALVASLQGDGHEVCRLVRRPIKEANEVRWDPSSKLLDGSVLEGFDAIIHLGGEGIGDKRWSKSRKEKIRLSRVISSTLLSEQIARLESKPEVFVLANAIGWYGSRGGEELTEGSKIGAGFLSEVCSEWENSAKAVEDSGVRTIYLRSGIVLSSSGGVLAKMLLPFKLGIGGKMGSGKQWMSWISLDDEVGAITHLMDTKSCNGAFNLTAPEPVTNREFAKTLGRTLKRPTILPLPGFILRILFRSRAISLMIEGQKVLPDRLQESGYIFNHSTLAEALKDLLG